MSTRQHLSNRANQDGVCFVLNDNSDQPDTSAYVNHEPWLSETDHRTGWNNTFKSGAYRGMLYGIVIRDYPKLVVSLVEGKSVPANMREFSLSLAPRTYRIDVTAPTVETQSGEPTSAGPCPGGWKDFTHKGSNARFIRMTCKICGTVRNEERHPPR